MAEGWNADVKKYVPDADERAIQGIARYCGIVLQKRDSSLVSFTDKDEVARVRDNFLKKKLGLTTAEADLDRAIDAVIEKMKGDRTKNRVTAYYLLAEDLENWTCLRRSLPTPHQRPRSPNGRIHTPLLHASLGWVVTG